MYSVWAYEYDDEWILANFDKYPNNKKLWESYVGVTEKQVPYESFRHHISRKLNLQSRARFTVEEHDWLRKKGNSYLSLQELTDAFNSRFNKTRTPEVICFERINIGVKYGFHPVGYMYQRDGYNVIKIASGKQGHVKYSRYVFENHFGKIPKGYAVVHLDNNTLNDDISNLVAVPKEWLGTMQQYGWFSKERELTKAALMWCELRSRINDGRKAIGLIEDQMEEK